MVFVKLVFVVLRLFRVKLKVPAHSVELGKLVGTHFGELCRKIVLEKAVVRDDFFIRNLCSRRNIGNFLCGDNGVFLVVRVLNPINNTVTRGVLAPNRFVICILCRNGLVAV